MSAPRILILDSHGERSARIADLLAFMDYQPRLANGADEIELGKRAIWDVLIVGDLADDEASNAFLLWLSRQSQHPQVLLLEGADNSLCQRFLHRDWLTTMPFPIKHAALTAILEAAISADVDTAQLQPGRGPTGTSDAVRMLKRMIGQVAPFDTTVLLLGESGTGKEVAARAVHEQSNRAEKPFVAVNCGAIPADLLESELFGHEKGAFTGALGQRKGRFELAEGGTLLLDEIGDMSMPMQVKLLRVLQERSFERVGGHQTIACDVRVIAATHRNLEKMVEEGRFREDLYYRLCVFPIETPPLRERVDDLPALIADIGAALGKRGKRVPRFNAAALRTLQEYAWPGNIRELCNLVERLAVLLPGGTVDVADLPARCRNQASGGSALPPDQALDEAYAVRQAACPDMTGELPVVARVVSAPSDGGRVSDERNSGLPGGPIDLKAHIRQIEIDLINDALLHSDMVVAKAASRLGVGRTTLVEKIKRYNVGHALDLSDS